MTDVLTRPASQSSPLARPGALVVSAAAAVAAAGAGLLAIAVFVLLAWSADARSGSGTPAALRAAGQVWLAAHGTPVRVTGGVFALLPLGRSANTPPVTRTGVPCAASHTWPAARRAAGVPDPERASADQASRTKTAMASSPAPAAATAAAGAATTRAPGRAGGDGRDAGRVRTSVIATTVSATAARDGQARRISSAGVP